MSSSPLSLPDFVLETFFSRWEFAADHHLTASDVESMTISELLELGGGADRAAFEQLHLGYTPTWGTDTFRDAVAQRYADVDAADVLGFAGAGEALFWSMQLFVEAGDHVIVTVPNYQSIESIPMATGVAVDGLELWTGSASGLRWGLDLDRFASLLRPETRLVSVNFPNNPTGFVPDLDTWLAFNELCHGRGVRVVSDEVYRGVEVDSSNTIPSAVDVNPSALSINVMSKAYGLPGLRIGWIASRDRDALGKLEHAKHYTSICNSAPSEYLAVVALRNADKILGHNRGIIAANDRIVADTLGRYPELFEYATPVGGCVSFPRYLGVDGVESFCQQAVEKHGVLLLPSSVYRSDVGEVPGDRFRIGIGRSSVPESLRVLTDFLDSR